ncbi:ATP-binding protein [Rhabdochromatium marinum]|uniref:ATP-binding protein n=1 Tax=Rhabdochromatium marinum TaxID=48729 RepID=UPI001907539A|nr:ATP-binding protein [Rhabdochromatium marinum]MBK1650310.1 hypothetical protein [Rhabdochromatium marinum]
MHEQAIAWLAQACADWLGQHAQPGDMAFTRALSGDWIDTLAASPHFHIDGWEVWAVRDQASPDSRTFTAEQAVERREDKSSPPTLLLIDSARAGAGLDGIYSAARELDERTLTDTAIKIARDAVCNYKSFTDTVRKRARVVAHRRRLSPWVEYSYLCSAARSASEAGAALAQLGLWPIAVDEKPNPEDLKTSALLVERLLPTQGSRQSPEMRVQALQWPAEQQAQANALIDLLRQHEGRSRQETLQAIQSQPELWVNRLRPGLIDGDELQAIHLESWRGRNNKPLKWSGLIEQDGRLELRLGRTPDQSTRGRLEIRWHVEPEALPKGAVEYLIALVAGHDTLAEKHQSHSGTVSQKAVFTAEDFDELDEDARFDAQVEIRSLGAEGKSRQATSEDFFICFGDPPEQTASTAGRSFPTLALALADVATDRDDWRAYVDTPGDRERFSIDKEGVIACRSRKRKARVPTSKLLLKLARDWVARQGEIGRWQLRVRADGERIGDPIFLPMDTASAAPHFIQASRHLAKHFASSGSAQHFRGPLGVIHDNSEVFNHYTLAAIELWQKETKAELALVHTLEILTQAGDCLGLIVLPTHPLRVAWQQALDALIWHHRYVEHLSANDIKDTLQRLTGSYCPPMLPGLTPGQTFVFADNLGLHAAALTPIEDPEPKATVALMSRLLGDEDSVAPSVGRGASKILAAEIQRYLELHPAYRRLRLHALRIGDAKPVARALGQVLKQIEEPTTDQESSESAVPTSAPDDWAPEQIAFDLWLHPAPERPHETLGAFIADTAARKRTGAGVIPEPDRWMLDSVARPNGVNLPRLRWYRRDVPQPEQPAHLALAFDLFHSEVKVVPLATLPKSSALEIHGLATMPTRDFINDPHGETYWQTWIAPNPRGPDHPVDQKLTERLLRLQRALMVTTTRHLGGSQSDWPVLITRIDQAQSDLLQQLHAHCDWVITADRNAGIEYFDSPQTLPAIYRAFIIDCVPERDDLGFMQLITSTSRIEEIGQLLAGALAALGLSRSERNCRALLEALKAISGRLVLRLGGTGNVTQESIALALVQLEGCTADRDPAPFPSLREGIFIPLDDVPEFFTADTKRQGPGGRADLLYVTATKQATLDFTFIEVKFRRHLKTARSGDLAQSINAQLEASCRVWERLFDVKTPALKRLFHRAWLARILRFYVQKGARHQLTQEAQRRFVTAIERLLLDADYELPAAAGLGRQSFVFCPEYNSPQPVPIDPGGDAQLWLFGPERLPDTLDGVRSPASRKTTNGVDSGATDQDAMTATVLQPITVSANKPVIEPDATDAITPAVDDVSPAEPARVRLGHRQPKGAEVVWETGIRGNPHLLMLGNSGMGKTTCLINLCQQLQDQGIVPIVFSYHQDIDQQLTATLSTPPQYVRLSGLGFNPLEIVATDNPHAFLDAAGMIRDIFAAIFPDLGAVQLGQIREALERSYRDQGWSTGGEQGAIPAFSAFLEVLRAEPKPDRRLLTRLNELDSYGLFAPTGATEASLLDTSTPSLVQIHSTQNDHLQRAFSSFVLYNLYQNMFRRGPQERLTHAIVIDEAHRAARLKLLPTLVKECRKYGLAVILASQEASDFDDSLFTAIASYLTLRVSEADARLMARNFVGSDQVSRYADRLKQLPKYQAMFYSEGMTTPMQLALLKA